MHRIIIAIINWVVCLCRYVAVAGQAEESEVKQYLEKIWAEDIGHPLWEVRTTIAIGETKPDKCKMPSSGGGCGLRRESLGIRDTSRRVLPHQFP